jgi:5-methylcytosine-specific restriction endonuclease McrA
MRILMLSAMQNKRLILALLPCLRCGKKSVALLAPKPAEPFERNDLICKRCGARHILAVLDDRVIYDRDTRRYPSDNYDDNEFPVIKLYGGKHSQLPGSTMSGPIIICKRKRRFSLKEFCIIFERSKGKCHLCGKRWKLSEHGRTGWHVDHEIPNAGGGCDTEELENFRVACARCNLKRGRGYTFRTVRLALEQLWE